MRKWLAILLLLAAQADAQEGFPLDGTWRGERPGRAKAPVTIVMVLQWDGQKVTGIINPGPDAIQITDAQLVPEGWHVSIRAKTPAGKSIDFEGILGELGSYNRSITGTWTEGGRSDNVRMVRE
jgi:hypothetical protein